MPTIYPIDVTYPKVWTVTAVTAIGLYFLSFRIDFFNMVLCQEVLYIIQLVETISKDLLLILQT